MKSERLYHALVLDNGTLNISGGQFGSGFRVFTDGSVNLFGREFFVDGDRVEGLTIGETTLLTQRDVELSGTLADGSGFSFDLNSEFSFDPTVDFFENDAFVRLTVVAVPEPSVVIFTSMVGLAVVRRTRRRRRSGRRG